MDKYSLQRYISKKVDKQCMKLPDFFNSLEDWESYKHHLKDKIKEILPVIPLSEKNTYEMVGSNLLEKDLLYQRVDVYMEDGLHVPLSLYCKEEKTKKPAILICPGYATPANDDQYVRFAMELARKGFLAAVIEYGGCGLASDRPDIDTNINNISAAAHLLGINEAALRVWYNHGAHRYLSHREDVNGEKIGITGLCQGSITLMYTLMTDVKFYAAASLCGVSTYQAEVTDYAFRQGGWTGISPFVFQILRYGDFQHMFSCFAPKPLLIQNNMVDIHWPYQGLEQVKKLTHQIYSLYDRPENVTIELVHGPHSYVGLQGKNIIDFFERNLYDT